MTNTIIVCGLTDWEKEEVKLHKGECRHCMHFDGWKDRERFVPYCDKLKKVLKKERSNCKDWFLDTR